MRRIVFGFMILAGSVWAASPVGQITSSGSINLSGVTIPGVAASAVPVVSGDEITTQGNSAVVTFLNQKRALIPAYSRARVQPTPGGGYTVQVVSSAVTPAATPADYRASTNAAGGVPGPPDRASKKCPPGHGGNGHDCRPD